VPIDRARTASYLKAFDFRTLFREELGWEKYAGELQQTVEGVTYYFKGIAEKRGVVAFLCGQIPDYAVRFKLDKLIGKSHFEHLIVFGDQVQGRQVWQWMRREPGKPDAIRAFWYSAKQTPELLLQKLDNLVVTLDDEEKIGMADILRGLRAGFDVEKVTKKFYERFKTEHARFLKFVDGIPDEHLQTWYASVMINRLMFLYFIQAKGFLAGDTRYLPNKLKESRDREKNAYYSEFLCPLFFQGFARRKEERTAATNRLLGEIPYLNGGLFQKHEIEARFGKKVEIADKAFEHIFAFFAEYDWHLDDREAARGDEINPDVLGYIFEKYINQKQMGAYYTKEDITGYISRNTIIPFLLDATRKECSIAFELSGGVWRLLQDDPDRYIYEAVRHGASLTLPSDISAGLSDISKRNGWNRTAPPECALPTEIWREVVERRRRYEDTRHRLATGHVHEVNELVTLNLDIRQFAQDVIQYAEGPELIRAFYKAITGISVLDPTCGSGAFLFAALNILKPLYEACLQRMQMFVDELIVSGAHHPKQFDDFRQVLAESRQHPKQDYFILKAIIVNNLYGVDIMEEAVEICKLRLFLKLVAQVDCSDRIEPLPDIDFNIRAGNTLVGYARLADISKGQANVFLEEQIAAIEVKAKIVDAELEKFRLQQTQLNGTVTAEDKTALRAQFADLDRELNVLLSAEYGVKKAGITAWRESHKPFHWCSDFYRIMHGGGFDVIIGNPPWKEYAAVKKDYSVRNYVTVLCGNLHGLATERAVSLARERGRFSFIVQLPLVSSSRMTSVRSVLRTSCDFLSVIPFDDRPGKLFEGLEHCRSTVFTCRKGHATSPCELVSRYQRWPTNARTYLFPVIEYVRSEAPRLFKDLFAKVGSGAAAAIRKKLELASNKPLGVSMSRTATDHFIFYQEATQYWVKATLGLPYYAKNGKVGAPAHGRYLYFTDAKVAHAASAVLNSSLFYQYFVVFGDCFHLSDTLVSNFPVPGEVLSEEGLVRMNKTLMADLKRNAVNKTIDTKDGDKIAYAEFSAGTSKPIMTRSTPFSRATMASPLKSSTLSSITTSNIAWVQTMMRTDHSGLIQNDAILNRRPRLESSLSSRII
jgi:hypothetical protein